MTTTAPTFTTEERHAAAAEESRLYREAMEAWHGDVGLALRMLLHLDDNAGAQNDFVAFVAAHGGVPGRTYGQTQIAFLEYLLAEAKRRQSAD